MKNICPECGAEMLDKTNGPYIHIVCPKCGYGLATYDYTLDDPIKFDEKIYTVKSVGNKTSIKALKVISKISNLNYVQCKALVETDGIICSGKAKEIIESIKELKQNNVGFEISPEFKYDIK